MKGELDLWRFLQSNFALFLFLVIFSSLVSSVGLGISPPEVELSGGIEEKICGELEFFSNGDLTLESRWSDVDSRELKDYVLNNFGIREIFEKEFYVYGEVKKKICFISSQEGEFYGVLIANLKNNDVGVGSWVDLKIYGEGINEDLAEFEEETLLLSKKSKGNFMFFFLFLMIFINSMFVFFILLALNKKRIYREY